jgi:hypothetical protein
LINAGKDHAPGQEPREILDVYAATAYAKSRFIWPNVRSAAITCSARRLPATPTAQGLRRGVHAEYDLNGWKEPDHTDPGELSYHVMREAVR